MGASQHVRWKQFQQGDMSASDHCCIVEQGTLKMRRGVETVVLKRVKTRVEGAEQMGQMEHLLNVHAATAARGAIAEFMGYLEVQPEQASTRLTQGLWLVRRSRSASIFLRDHYETRRAG